MKVCALVWPTHHIDDEITVWEQSRVAHGWSQFILVLFRPMHQVKWLSIFQFHVFLLCQIALFMGLKAYKRWL